MADPWKLAKDHIIPDFSTPKSVQCSVGLILGNIDFLTLKAKEHFHVLSWSADSKLMCFVQWKRLLCWSLEIGPWWHCSGAIFLNFILCWNIAVKSYFYQTIFCDLIFRRVQMNIYGCMIRRKLLKLFPVMCALEDKSLLSVIYLWERLYTLTRSILRIL